MKRLAWLDVARGLAILLVVYFHFFMTYVDGRPAPSWDWATMSGGAGALAGASWLRLAGVGWDAVGLFIALSGWALMESTSRRAASGPIKWGSWYVARLVRLYPMYWVAHLVYLLSPFVARLEPVDSRIVLSLLGFRFIDISRNFHYLNAAWWYFALLLQLVLMFPLLFRAARRLGPWRFLAVAAAVGFLARYLLLVVYQQNGVWSTGGLALCRLPEFALGMALGMWHARSPEKTEKFFLGGAGLVAGILLYPLAMQLYANIHTYVFVDFATGVCCMLVVLGLSGLIVRCPMPTKILSLVGAFSYGIFLVHQPYVIWIGLRIREQPVWMFLLISVAVLAATSLWGIALEKATNAVVQRISEALKGPKPAAG
ncbi:MAG: acyltransferase family protein [Chthoniobacterales bacterium]